MRYFIDGYFINPGSFFYEIFYSLQIFPKPANVHCKWIEPPHDKTNEMTMLPAKTQISLGIHPVWSESSLFAQWEAKDPSFLHADSEDSDWTRQMARLIWVFDGHTDNFVGLVMRWLNSSYCNNPVFWQKGLSKWCRPITDCSIKQKSGATLFCHSVCIFLTHYWVCTVFPDLSVLHKLRQKKKCLISGNPTDPTFLGPTLNFLGHLRIFLLFLGYFERFSCFKKKKKKKKIFFFFAYLPTLKPIETFLETRHLFVLALVTLW